MSMGACEIRVIQCPEIRDSVDFRFERSFTARTDTYKLIIRNGVIPGKCRYRA